MADEPLYSERLIDALGVAARLHAGQRRKGGDVPYLSHLLGTCGSPWTTGRARTRRSPRCSTTRSRTSSRRRLARARVGRLRARGRCGSSRAAPTRTRTPSRRGGSARRRTSPTSPDLDAPILLVSAADKLHNARSIVTDLHRFGAATWDRFNGVATGPSGTTARWSTPSAPTRLTRPNSSPSWTGP